MTSNTNNEESVALRKIFAKLSSLVDTVVGAIASKFESFASVMVERVGHLEQRMNVIETRLSNAEAVSAEYEQFKEATARLSNDARSMYLNFREGVKSLPESVRSHPDVKRVISTLGDDLKKVVKDITNLAYFDNLTGLYSRNYLAEFLMSAEGRYIGFVLDIDHFKKINDTHGHDVGDQVLKNVSDTIRRIATNRGIELFRLGGEEIGGFWQTRPLSRASNQENIAFLRGVLEAIRIEVQNTCKCTVSIGVSDILVDLPLKKFQKEDVFWLFGDKNLYAAKNGGRNRVVINEPALLASMTNGGVTASHRQDNQLKPDLDDRR